MGPEEKEGEGEGEKDGDKPSGDGETDKPSGDKPSGDGEGEKPDGDKPEGDKPTGDKPEGDSKDRRLADEDEKGPKGCRGKNKQRNGIKDLDESDKEKVKEEVEEGKAFLKSHEQKMGKCIKGMMKYTSAMLCSGCSTTYDNWVQVDDNGD